MRTDFESGARVQKIVWNLLIGTAPERRNDLAELRTTYSPEFCILFRVSGRDKFVMETDIDNRVITFSVHALRAFWLGSFMMWEAYSCLHEIANGRVASFDRLDEMLETFGRTTEAEDPWSVRMPAGVPEPERFEGLVGEEKMTRDLAIFALGWVLLHEVGHLQYEQDGTIHRHEDSADQRHQEEFSCDAFATNFLWSHVEDFALSRNTDADKIRQKRAMGIYAALFVLVSLGPCTWEQSESHPAFQKRVDAVTELIGGSTSSMSDAFGLGAFGALMNRWPNVPGPPALRRA